MLVSSQFAVHRVIYPAYAYALHISTPSTDVYLKNNHAKLHPNPTWNDGALGFFKDCCCCCCCYDEPIRHCLYGGQRGPEEMRNSTRLWIWRDPSLPRGNWQPFINWGTTQGRLSLPSADVLSTIVKQMMLTMSTNCQAAVGSPTL